MFPDSMTISLRLASLRCVRPSFSSQLLLIVLLEREVFLVEYTRRFETAKCNRRQREIWMLGMSMSILDVR